MLLFLEWNTWRAMTMLDGGTIKGNFRIDDAGRPTSTAQGNMRTLNVIMLPLLFRLKLPCSEDSGNMNLRESQSHGIMLSCKRRQEKPLIACL